MLPIMHPVAVQEGQLPVESVMQDSAGVMAQMAFLYLDFQCPVVVEGHQPVQQAMEEMQADLQEELPLQAVEPAETEDF